MAQTTASPALGLHDLLEIARRRKWVIVAPFVVVAAAAVFLARALPNVYRASTLILVERPQVPEDYVKSTVTTRIEDRLATIRQQILSRTRLEGIIREFGLQHGRDGEVPMEAAVGQMRRAIDVDVIRDNAFTISYRGRDPRTVRDVTNELAAVFIEENSKVREEQAESTSEFLEAQLVQLKQLLVTQERKVREFKERHMGQLPQQLEANLRALDRLQLQSQAIVDQIRSAEQRRLLLQVQLSTTPQTLEAAGPVAQPAGGAGRPAASPRESPAARLAAARANLQQLRSRYTDLHPDVIRAEQEVRELAAIVARSGTGAAEGTPADGGEPGALPNPLYVQLQAQLKGVEREIADLHASQARVAEQVRRLQAKIEEVPRLEQQLMELTRDYNNTQSTYESLLSKKLSAQIAENLEKRQKGEQFRVLDPARLPQTPYKPDRLRIVVLGVVLGLGLGAACAYGLELLDHSIRSPRDLKALLPQVPLIGTIPVVPDPSAVRRRRLASAAIAVLVLALGTAAFAGAVRYKDQVVSLGVFEILLR